MKRVFSGIKPSGEFTLGNYLGALRHWVTFQDDHDALYCVVDLHALTEEIDPTELRANTLDAALNMLAVGLDPDRCTLFVQGHVPEHTRLTWLLECTTSFGEMRRMTQFKDKSEGQELVRVGLFTYPVLMAADILLYDTTYVPVGDDQRQHLELAREVATRFNNRYGLTFTIPEAAIPGTAARVMDLQHPERKMSKTIESPLGTIRLLDSDEDITRKVRKAVTDTDGEVRYDPGTKPGLANLLELLSAATGRAPKDLAGDYTRYGPLKDDVAAALSALLAPVRARRAELERELGYVDEVLTRGAARAHEIATATYARAADAIGLLPPSTRT
jgi:tryptophanyl-tRNA synthetase